VDRVRGSCPWTVSVDRGPWTLDLDRGTYLWTVDRVRGPWTVDRGPWTVDRGPWTVDRVRLASVCCAPGPAGLVQTYQLTLRARVKTLVPLL